MWYLSIWSLPINLIQRCTDQCDPYQRDPYQNDPILRQSNPSLCLVMLHHQYDPIWFFSCIRWMLPKNPFALWYCIVTTISSAGYLVSIDLRPRQSNKFLCPVMLHCRRSTTHAGCWLLMSDPHGSVRMWKKNLIRKASRSRVPYFLAIMHSCATHARAAEFSILMSFAKLLLYQCST